MNLDLIILEIGDFLSLSKSITCLGEPFEFLNAKKFDFLEPGEMQESMLM
jgi:hypothetical protein